jgi:hypothetical protein
MKTPINTPILGVDIVLKHEKRKTQVDYMRMPKEPPHYNKYSTCSTGDYYYNKSLAWREQESKYNQKMEIYKAEKVKYKQFTKEKLQENTPKKHKSKNETYKNKNKMAVIENNKKNAPINKSKQQNGTLITNSSRN